MARPAGLNRGMPETSKQTFTRPRRPLRRAAGIAALVFLGLTVTILLPPVQLAAFRLLTSNLDGATVELSGLSAGPWGLKLSGLRFAQDGVELDVDDVDANLALWASIRHRRLELESLTVAAAALQLAGGEAGAAVPDAAAADRAVVAGDQRGRLRALADAAVWPEWLAIRALAADAVLSIDTATGTTVSGTVNLAGRDWQAGAAASADLAGSLTAARGPETLAAVDLSAMLGGRIGADAGFDALQLTAQLASADGARAAALTAEAQFGESALGYQLTLDNAAGARLAELTGEIDAAGALSAEWVLDLPAGLLAAFARGRSVADIVASSTGTVRFDPAASVATIVASGSAVGSGWAAFDPRLERLGTVTLRFDADAEIAGGIATARAARVTLDSAEIGEVLAIEALQPLSFERDDWLVDPENRGEPAVSVRLNEMPIRWLRHFDPTGQLIDGTLAFAFELVRDQERRTRLVASEPLRAASIRLRPVGDTAIPEFSITLVPQIVLADGELDAVIEQLTIDAETGLSVEFSGTGRTSRERWPAADFEGTLAATVPALQRIVPALGQLRATAAMHFNFESLLLSVAGASLGADGIDGREILAADLSGQVPLEIALPLFRPDWDAFQPQTLTMAIDRMPIDWLSPYIPELELRGGELSGRLEATTAVGSGLLLSASEPLVLDNLVPVYRGRAAGQAVTASVIPSLRLSNTASALVLEALSLRTPGGDELYGAVSLESSGTGDSIEVDISLRGTFPTLVSRSGARIGTLQLEQRGSLSAATRRLDVERLVLGIADAEEATFLELENLQPFFIVPEPFAVGTDGASAEILRASVTPLRLEQLLPRVFGLDLEGLLPEGEFFGRVETGGGLVIAADEPLEFRDVSVSWDEAALLDRVTMSARYEIAYSVGGVEVRSVDLRATNPAGDLMLETASEVLAPLSPDRTWSRLATTVTAELPRLRGQPVLADLPDFTSGHLSIAVAASNEATQSLRLSASLREAATGQLGPLPDVQLAVEADGVRGERVAVSIPIALDSAEFGASDLRFDGTLARMADGPDRLSAALSGGRLAVPDLMKLGELLSPPRAGGDRAGAEPPPGDSGGSGDPGAMLSAVARLRADRHVVPVWTDSYDGAATIAIDRLDFRSFDVAGLNGRFDVSPTQIAATGLQASLLGAALGADATVSFDADEPSPYALEFDATVADVELGRFFRAVDPAALPTTEGVFDLTAELDSRGRNPIDLGLSALGEIRLRGRDGIFRGLADFAGTGSTASRVVGFLTFSRELRALARLLEGLGEIRFEDADVVLVRQARGRLEFRSLSLRSPQISLQASGNLALAPERPLLLSPLELSAVIAARGDVAVLFDGMELLEAETDDNEDDYRSVIRPIEILGTPAEPDATAFWQLLEVGAENARGSFGVGLRALNRRLEQNAEAAPE